MSERAWDVIVIGAGAAGLMAALRAAERGRRTLLLEKNRKRRRQDPDVRRHALQYHPRHRQSRHRRGLRAAGQIPAFRAGGLQRASRRSSCSKPKASRPRSRRRARFSPSAIKAADVLAALLRRFERSGADAGARRSRSGRFERDRRRLSSCTRRCGLIAGGKVILTTGGQSYPGSRHHRRRLSFRRAVRAIDRSAAPRAGAADDRTSPGSLSCAASRCPTSRSASCDRTANRLAPAARLAAVRAFRLVWSGRFWMSAGSVSGHPRPQNACRRDRSAARAQTEPELARIGCATESLASGKKQLAVVLGQQLPRRLAEIVLEQAGLPRIGRRLR